MTCNARKRCGRNDDAFTQGLVSNYLPFPDGGRAMNHDIQQCQYQHWLLVDSAGVRRRDIGQPSDSRTIEGARHNEVDLSAWRAQSVSSRDFAHYDWLLCAHSANIQKLTRRAWPAAAPSNRVEGCLGQESAQ